jgi:DNA polymerase-3 subunit delta
MIFFFYGSNTYEARQQLAKIRGQFFDKTGSDLGLDRLDGARATLAQLKAVLQAAPFLSSSRLVIVEQLGANKAVTAKIGDLLSSIPKTTVAVFYDPGVDQRTSYFKTMVQQAKAVEFLPLSQPKLVSWIGATVKAQGGEIDRPAAGRLLELAGEDQWRLSNEIAKLIQLSPKVTVENINAMVESTQIESIFNLVEVMTSGKTQTAMKIYQELRADGQSEMYILSMVIWQLRNLLVAKSAGKITPPQLAKAAGMSPYVAGKMLAKRHLYTEQQLKQAFSEAVETDYKIKSGVADGDTLVEQLILKLANDIRAATTPRRP